MSSNNEIQAGSSSVYTGLWLDHDRGGRLRASVLTLRNRDAAILISFLAVLVSFAATRSWRIWRLLLHSLSFPKKVESLDQRGNHRLQVVLRNRETAGSAIRSLAWLLFDKKRYHLSRTDGLKTLIWLVLATLHVVGFIAAGILTSQLVIGRIVVSKHTPSCGQWSTNISRPVDQASSIQYDEYHLNRTIDSDNYVRNCYPQGVSRDMLDCGILISRFLDIKTESNLPCPFDPEICVNGTNSAFAMDSGNITLSQLGINGKFSKQLSVRRRNVCAPIYAQPFLYRVLTSEDEAFLSDDESMFLMSYFQVGGRNQTETYRFGPRGDAYSIRAYYVEDVANISQPAEPLRSHDSITPGLSLVAMTGTGIVFAKPQDDPWFSAHRRANVSFNDPALSAANDVPPMFLMDRLINLLACEERYQTCNDLTKNCTAWHSLMGTASSSELIGALFPELKDEYEDIVYSTSIATLNMYYTSIARAIQNRDAAALQASRYLRGSQHTKIEPEQWKTELTYWFSMGLARLQLDIFNTIERPRGEDVDVVVNLWTGPQESFQRFCGRIKFRSAEYTTLSATGLFVVVALTAILVLFSFTDTVLESLPQKWQGANMERWLKTEDLALVGEMERLQDQLSQQSEGDFAGSAHIVPVTNDVKHP